MQWLSMDTAPRDAAPFQAKFSRNAPAPFSGAQVICRRNEAGALELTIPGADGRSILLDEDLLEGWRPLNDGQLSQGKIYDLRYRNYRGEIANRRVLIDGIKLGSNQFHQSPGLLLSCLDVERNVHREFALGDCDFLTLTMAREVDE